MGAGIQRNKDQGCVSPGAGAPCRGAEFSTLRISFVPRVLFPAGSYAFLFHVFFLSHGFLKGTQRDSQGGQGRCPLGARAGACTAPAPGAQTSASRGLLSCCWVLLCVLTHRVLLAPCPLSPCSVVAVIVSLWLFIGHSAPVSSFSEGKRPVSGATGWRERPRRPLGLGCVLRPRGTEAWGKGRLLLLLLLFF